MSFFSYLSLALRHLAPLALSALARFGDEGQPRLGCPSVRPAGAESAERIEPRGWGWVCCLLLFSSLLYAQPGGEDFVPFNGRIVDVQNRPVRGVRVYTFDRNFSTTSDRKGRFGLSNVLPSDTIHLSYRRTRYDIPVDGMRSMYIILGDQGVAPQVQYSVELEDLGYGYVSRRESVSSSQGISGEVLRRMGCVSIMESLQGLVPGLVIQTGPFGQATVCIRGPGSIMCPTEPLYVIDGTVVSSLDFVSIYDVESVEVMKDAYIYGSRGANGAILVTTKGSRSH